MKSFLKGQALKAVEGLALTSENYKEAVTILEKRYGNKQLLISSHIEKLMNLPPVKSELFFPCESYFRNDTE